METFEEMKKRYQNDMFRYAKLARPAPELTPAQQADDSVPEPVPAPDDIPVSEASEDHTAYNGTGKLIVRATTAREALPLEGVLVIVTRMSGGQQALVWTGITDISGNTSDILLPAPDEGRSERPGDSRPYASYTIQAIKKGYYTAEFRNVPIFSGVTAVQPADMIPLPEQTEIVPEMIVVERAPDL